MASGEYRRLPGETARDAKKRYLRAWCKAHPGHERARKRRYLLKKQYGLTEAQYQELLKKQAGLCAICSRHLSATSLQPSSPVVDHKDAKVRGILCNHCNQALGLFRDNVDFLKSAIVYLQERG
jgi:hypothetical protein